MRWPRKLAEAISICLYAINTIIGRHFAFLHRTESELLKRLSTIRNTLKILGKTGCTTVIYATGRYSYRH